VENPPRFLGPLLRLLRWCRVVDAHDGLVSLTNLAVIVAIAKLARVHDASVTDLLTLMVTMLAYGYKRRTGAKAIQNTELLDKAKAAVDAVGALTADLQQTKAELKTRMDGALLGLGLGRR
jgi:hypothetical protein